MFISCTSYKFTLILYYFLIKVVHNYQTNYLNVSYFTLPSIVIIKTNTANTQAF